MYDSSSAVQYHKSELKITKKKKKRIEKRPKTSGDMADSHLTTTFGIDPLNSLWENPFYGRGCTPAHLYIRDGLMSIHSLF